MNRIELRPATNARAMCGEVAYLEIYVDGLLLREHFANSQGELPDAISPLGWPLKGAEAVTFGEYQRFLLAAPADLADGRNSVLVCPLDADPGCGAYSALIERDNECVVWRDFAYENNYDPESRETAPYAHVGPFTFDWDEYAAELVRNRSDGETDQRERA